MEHEALNKRPKLQRVEYFPCKWGTFRHQSKVLGNQWESFQWSSRNFQMGSYLTTTKKLDYEKGVEALWDLGHQDWEVTILLADHAKTWVASKNSLCFPQRITTQKYSILLTPYPVLVFLIYCILLLASLASACKTKCVFWARSSELLSGVSVPDTVNL